jgi:hypothetical protein
MNYKKYIILVVVFISVFAFSSFFRNSETVKKMFNPDTISEFKDEYHDFGNMKQNIEEEFYFVYKNTGNHPLKIKNITSSCGCTIPKWSRKELKVGEKDSVLVKYDSKALGYFSKSIYVFSNSETSPNVLYIKGTVKK